MWVALDLRVPEDPTGTDLHLLSGGVFLKRFLSCVVACVQARAVDGVSRASHGIAIPELCSNLHTSMASDYLPVALEHIAYCCRSSFRLFGDMSLSPSVEMRTNCTSQHLIGCMGAILFLRDRCPSISRRLCFWLLTFPL